MRVSGMPVHIETTSAMSSSSTFGASSALRLLPLGAQAVHRARAAMASARAARPRTRTAGRDRRRPSRVASRSRSFCAASQLTAAADVVADAHAADGLVDEVDRLVGQEAVGDVADATARPRPQRLVGDGHLVVLLVALRDALQDLDRLLDASARPPCTGWKRRSSAASLSMCLRYSSSVVAPMHCSSPRARAGLRMLAASIAPSAAPAPTSVCSSSMNRMSSSWLARISSMTFLRRSSNSPRYLVPATSEPMSSVSTRLSSSVSGTSPCDDAVGQALDDGGLADARLADEARGCSSCGGDRIWIDALDLALAADDRVELPAARGGGEVDAELVERGGAAVWRPPAGRAAGLLRLRLREDARRLARAPARGSRRGSRARPPRCPRPRARGRAAGAPCRCTSG